MCTKSVVWLEDHPEDVVPQILYCKNVQNLDIHGPLWHLWQFQESLNKFKSSDGNNCLLIIDILLYGVKSLSPLAENIETRFGLDAGWLVVKHFLRTEGSPYARMPILFLSTRPIIPEEEAEIHRMNQEGKSMGHSCIKYIEKGGLIKGRSITWDQAFEEAISDWVGGRWNCND